MKFSVDEVKGFDCYTNFYGMDITRDKACSMIKKMMEIMQATVQKSTLKELVKIFLKEEIGKQIQTECSKIYPLQDSCMIRKAKILKKPKFDLTKLMELYKDTPESQKAAPVEETVNAIAAEV